MYDRAMTAEPDGARRCMVFLCEDDRAGRVPLADLLEQRARALDGVQVMRRRGIEGFGSSGRLRAERLPDLARGLPVVLDVAGTAGPVGDFVAALHELAPGVLVTVEPVAVPAPVAGAR